MSKYIQLGGGDIEVPVRGTSFRQAHIPEPGSYWFVLEAEPRNRHDRNAVAVIAKRTIGYLPAEVAAGWSTLCQRVGRKRFTVEGEVRFTSDGIDRWVLLYLPTPEAISRMLD